VTPARYPAGRPFCSSTEASITAATSDGVNASGAFSATTTVPHTNPSATSAGGIVGHYGRARNARTARASKRTYVATLTQGNSSDRGVPRFRECSYTQLQLTFGNAAISSTVRNSQLAVDTASSRGLHRRSPVYIVRFRAKSSAVSGGVSGSDR
jgi:hypothetical protein